MGVSDLWQYWKEGIKALLFILLAAFLCMIPVMLFSAAFIFIGKIWGLSFAQMNTMVIVFANILAVVLFPIAFGIVKTKWLFGSNWKGILSKPKLK